MSEDRTQAPSRQRRQMARERGLAARSGELTAAAGLLTAVVLLGSWGGPLAGALDKLLGSTMATADGTATVGVAEVAGRLRAAAVAVVLPLATIAVGVAGAMLAVHLLQTGGLWAPALLAPDPSRFLRGIGSGAGVSARIGRNSWGLARTVVLTAVAAWAFRDALPGLSRLDRLEGAALAVAAAALLRRFAFTIGLAWLVLGVVDYALQWRRLEAYLRLTPEESREEQKSIDGDPGIRARRLQVVRSRLAAPEEAVKGAALILTGPAGLAVVLSGSPPPGRVTVRLVARGRLGLGPDSPGPAAGCAAAGGPGARTLVRPGPRRRPCGRGESVASRPRGRACPLLASVGPGLNI